MFLFYEINSEKFYAASFRNIHSLTKKNNSAQALVFKIVQKKLLIIIKNRNVLN